MGFVVMHDLNQIKHDVIDVLCSEAEHVRAIYIFGSYADGTATDKSDVDIGLRCRAEIPLEKFWELSSAIESRLNCKVDLLDMIQISTVMRMQIVSKGIRIYSAEHYEAETFDDFVFSSYARLNEERSGILKDIAKRGRVYG